MDLIGFLPDFGNIFLSLGAFIVALSVIIAVHEYGHYIVGRWSGIHADVFSLGFGPVLASRVDRRGTRWQLAAIPLGGYVKFAGDANAASAVDGEAIATLTPAERRRTMHGAPLWARTATVAAGPLFNFLMSIAVFAAFFWVKGIATDVPVVAEVTPVSEAAAALLPGDTILALNGQPTPDWEALGKAADTLPDAATAPYTVLRNGTEMQITGPHPQPPLAENVTPFSAAAEAGVLPGDLVLAVNGTPVASFNALREIIGASDGQPQTLTLRRNGAETTITVTPKRQDLPLKEGGFETRWLLGLSGGLIFSPETRTPGPVEGLWLGVQQVGNVISTSLSGLGHMIAGKISTCNMQGAIGIAKTSAAAASDGLPTFIWFIAMLSTAIGMMNLFPIPVLDGGHLVFFAYEAVFRRPPSEKVMGVLMTMGLAILISVMVFGLSRDVLC
ncbi:MAG: RIP metalloprotease RseP [Gemmobacter sp.]|uniref:RIP metalloprotease RseP n=1 Tax=Gemmobacter sp. TaxID=1898957 RepID=UPI001A63D63A|nr:RIP metalloprotease RseP [Gemmobacter sp.]MBL8563377.1 RIP metalloprotease RseP [Gemmobacter sp.]